MNGTRPRALGDALALFVEPVRVRLVALLSDDELGVGEIVRALQLPQSTVSRHLKTLDVAGWTARRALGTASLVRLAPERLSADEAKLWELVRADPALAEDLAADRERLRVVLAERAEDASRFFERLGGAWDPLRDQLFGRRFLAPTIAALIAPDVVFADLGCGTGELLALIAPHVRKAIGVDRERAMLATARERLHAHAHVELHIGTLERLPLPDQSIDLALLALVLHHLPEPAAALAEAARVLTPGGRLIVADMQPHDKRAWRAFGHLHQGFARADLDAFAHAAGLNVDRYVPLPVDPDAQGPPLFVATLVAAKPARKPARAGAKQKAS